MFGFIAFYLNEIQNKAFKYENKSLNLFDRAIKLVKLISNYLSTFSMIILISVHLIQSKAITRLILLSSTVLIIINPDPNFILCNQFLVALGDVSYSVYMVHWPLFEVHRYWAFIDYFYRQRASYFSKSLKHLFI